MCFLVRYSHFTKCHCSARTSGKDDVSFSTSSRPFKRNVGLGSTTKGMHHVYQYTGITIGTE